jgi:hypothetical protein
VRKVKCWLRDECKALLELQFIKFTICSGTGLFLDISTFYFLTLLKMHVFFSNAISSFIAITFVYITTTKFVYLTANYSLDKFVRFVSFYCISILVFSSIVWGITFTFIFTPLQSKVMVIPFSLIINYFFSTKIINQ